MATATNAVATQELFSHSHLDGESEIWAVPAGTAQNTLVREGNEFAVTLTTAPGGSAVETKELGPYTFSRPVPVGVGNDEVEAVGGRSTGVSRHGTWVFKDIAGATTATLQGAGVYVDPDGDLTTTAASNTRVGAVNYSANYTKVAGELPVKIGA